MVRSYMVSKEGVKMIDIIECDDYEAAKSLILDYSKIEGAEGVYFWSIELTKGQKTTPN